MSASSRRRSRAASTTVTPNLGLFNSTKDASVADKLKSPTGAGSKGHTGALLTSVIDAEYIPLAVDVCNWVAEQTNSCIEIEQFIPCLQDGIVLCRLLNALNKLKSAKYGEPFKLTHFRETIGNSVFFARVNCETFTRWSKNFGVADTDTCSVSDLVDLKDVMQALNNLFSVGRRCAELGLPHPAMVALEKQHKMRYNDMVGLFDPARGQLGKDDTLAKQALIDLINIRGLGALRQDAVLSEHLGSWKKRLVGKWAGTEITPPTPDPLPPTPPPPPPAPPAITEEPEPVFEPISALRSDILIVEAKMGPWDEDELSFLISLYKQQLDQFGDDHIDFQLLSKSYSRRFKHRTPHQCWDKMFQLIERYQCDRQANRLFRRKVCSGPHHDQLHLCLGDLDLDKHRDSVYTGMAHPKAPTLPAYIACGEAEKRSAELTGREQIAEQTVLLKAINENLAGIRESTERNTTTNAALLVLLTHVLKGDPVENGAGAGEGAVYGGRTGAADAENHGRENSLLLDLVDSKSFPSDVTDEMENGDHDE